MSGPRRVQAHTLSSLADDGARDRLFCMAFLIKIWQGQSIDFIAFSLSPDKLNERDLPAQSRVLLRVSRNFTTMVHCVAAVHMHAATASALMRLSSPPGRTRTQDPSAVPRAKLDRLVFGLGFGGATRSCLPVVA